MAWRCSGDKPLSEPMMVSLPTHICVTRPHKLKQLLPHSVILLYDGNFPSKYSKHPHSSLPFFISHTQIVLPHYGGHNEHDGVANHQPHDCLLNRLFRRRSKKLSKLRATGLCAGNSPVTGEFPTQRAINAEDVSIR